MVSWTNKSNNITIPKGNMLNFKNKFSFTEKVKELLVAMMEDTNNSWEIELSISKTCCSKFNRKEIEEFNILTSRFFLPKDRLSVKKLFVFWGWRKPKVIILWQRLWRRSIKTSSSWVEWTIAEKDRLFVTVTSR